MESNKIIIKKDGQEVECEVLFTFDSEDTGKSYVGYTDNTVLPTGRKKIYVSSYDPVIGMGNLEKVTSEEELKMIQDVLAQLDEESKL